MAKEYTVLKVTPMSRVADEGGIEKYYRIQFKAKGGTVDSVNISEGDYTEEKAAPILLKAAQNADKILKL